MESFAAELVDRFGKLPKEVVMLINVMKIKYKCFEAGIVKLEGGPRGATIRFYRDKFNNPERLMEYIKNQSDLIKVRDNRLVIKRDWKKIDEKIRGAYAIASDLAHLAKAKKAPS